jgi:hypothetical protein
MDCGDERAIFPSDAALVFVRRMDILSPRRTLLPNTLKNSGDSKRSACIITVFC